ncbi:hypothetical protein NPIL_580511 [Nephila pilipes]|uniref:Uncharacterized protein n=1 Tax=Nephila pilipes TaxID=299642 RepID=A0A8X6QYN5_NEPPI|nr:hypothetical protein NPIL_580511 [Nephila pilipes]
MEYFDLVYDKPYARLSSYLVGIALGRYFYETRVSKKRINKAANIGRFFLREKKKIPPDPLIGKWRALEMEEKLGIKLASVED